MKHSIKVGFSFGLTSGVITTLGLMVGLLSGTNSKIAVIGGIITIAVADALSDSLGIHISEESENKHTSKEVWESTLSTFFTKFLLALSFLVPLLVLELYTAVTVAVAWGLMVLGTLSFLISRSEGSNPFKVITEHVGIALLVVAIAYSLGVWISAAFG